MTEFGFLLLRDDERGPVRGQGGEEGFGDCAQRGGGGGGTEGGGGRERGDEETAGFVVRLTVGLGVEPVGESEGGEEGVFTDDDCSAVQEPGRGGGRGGGRRAPDEAAA